MGKWLLQGQILKKTYKQNRQSDPRALQSYLPMFHVLAIQKEREQERTLAIFERSIIAYNFPHIHSGHVMRQLTPTEFPNLEVNLDA